MHLDWLKIMYNYNACIVYITSGLITYLANLLCAIASSGKLPITYPLFWEKKKWCNWISIKELWNCTIKQDDILLTNQVWGLFCISNRSCLDFWPKCKVWKKRKKVVKLTVWTKKMRLVRYLVYLLVQTKGRGREKLNSKNTFLVSYSKI